MINRTSKSQSLNVCTMKSPKRILSVEEAREPMQSLREPVRGKLPFQTQCAAFFAFAYDGVAQSNNCPRLRSFQSDGIAALPAVWTRAPESYTITNMRLGENLPTLRDALIKSLRRSQRAWADEAEPENNMSGVAREFEAYGTKSELYKTLHEAAERPQKNKIHSAPKREKLIVEERSAHWRGGMKIILQPRKKDHRLDYLPNTESRNRRKHAMKTIILVALLAVASVSNASPMSAARPAVRAMFARPTIAVQEDVKGRPKGRVRRAHLIRPPAPQTRTRDMSHEPRTGQMGRWRARLRSRARHAQPIR